MHELKQEQSPQTVAQAAAEQSSILTEATIETNPATQQVAEMLTRAQRKIRRRMIRGWTLFALLQTPNILIWLGILARPFSHKPNPFLWLRDYYASPVGAICLFGVVVLAISSMQSSAADVEEIVEVGGVKAIGPLVDTLSAPAFNRDAVYGALTLLLPRLKASDALLLDARQRQRLLSILGWRDRWLWLRHRLLDVKLAILKALEQVGDAKAIPVVERLAGMKGRTERRRRLREAAEACLPLLRANAGLVEANQTLLRPAGSPPAGSDMLVRPAGAASDSGSEALLRPAEER